MDLDTRVYNSISPRNWRDRMTFNRHYVVALAHFKLEHPVRQGLNEDYVYSWIRNYMNTQFGYVLRNEKS